tara:strand:- start:1090 stop:2031 length:942 start_codon:yes stop_codon:yes gene_type:complete
MEIKTIKSVISKEIKALELLKDSIGDNFIKAIELLYKTNGKIVISGMGKSSHIAKKIASTFSSVGSPSFFVHPGEANHGDLGMITKKECIILISNSGETSELFNIILHCKKLKIPLIAITSNSMSTLGKKSDVVLKIPKKIEACPLELAPTSSTTASLVIGDALAVTLLKKNSFTKQDFSNLHPGGKLGFMLLKATDIMKKKPFIPIVEDNENMDKAILEMSSKGLGCVGIVSTNKKKLIGIITDGDLRRKMNPNLLSESVKNIMNKTPKTIEENILIIDILKFMNKKSITSIFVTKKKKPIGIIHMHDILRY